MAFLIEYNQPVNSPLHRDGYATAAQQAMTMAVISMIGQR
jgi:hypothetical protein